MPRPFPEGEPPRYVPMLWAVLTVIEDVALMPLVANRDVDRQTFRAHLVAFSDGELRTTLDTVRAVTVTSFELRCILEEEIGQTPPEREINEFAVNAAMLSSVAKGLLTLVPGPDSHSQLVRDEARHYTQQALIFVAGVVVLASSQTDLSTRLAYALTEVRAEERRWMRMALDLVFWTAACLSGVLEKEPQKRQREAGTPR